MNLFERRNAIMKILRKEGHTTVTRLTKMFDVSERTIYSDITALSLDQPIQTVRGRYGGGVKLASWFHPNANCQRRGDFVVFRRTENVEKWRVKVYSLWIIILAVFACQA